MTTHHAIESSDLVKRRAPLLAEVASTIGDVQVRNRGTIGGSIAQADPAADLPAALLAHEATIVLAGGARRRVVRAEQMFVDAYESALEDGEIVVEVRVPAIGDRTGWAYEKLTNRASRFAIVGVGALITKATDGTCERARIAIIGAGAVPTRAKAAERYLTGKPLTDDTLEKASRRAGQGIDFLSDGHGSAAYREHLTSELTRRALARAVERA
jgi:carbon-monoxide dehydrogenase medium subunit